MLVEMSFLQSLYHSSSKALGGQMSSNMYLKNEHLKVDDQGKVSQSDIATSVAVY